MGKDLSFLPPKYIAILDHIKGRNSAFFPLKCKVILPHTGRSHACFLEVHPSPASPKNATLPYPQILSHLYDLSDDSSPFKMQNPKKSFPINSFFITLFTRLFLFIYFFSFFFFFDYLKFLFFPKKLGILPQSGKIIPRVWGE